VLHTNIYLGFLPAALICTVLHMVIVGLYYNLYKPGNLSIYQICHFEWKYYYYHDAPHI